MQGDDTVVSCSLASPTSTTIVAKFSYNDGRTNTPIDDVSAHICQCNVKKSRTLIEEWSPAQVKYSNGRIHKILTLQAHSVILCISLNENPDLHVHKGDDG